MTSCLPEWSCHSWFFHLEHYDVWFFQSDSVILSWSHFYVQNDSVILGPVQWSQWRSCHSKWLCLPSSYNGSGSHYTLVIHEWVSYSKLPSVWITFTHELIELGMTFCIAWAGITRHFGSCNLMVLSFRSKWVILSICRSEYSSTHFSLTWSWVRNDILCCKNRHMLWFCNHYDLVIREWVSFSKHLSVWLTLSLITHRLNLESWMT